MSDGTRRMEGEVRAAQLFSHADPLPEGAVEAVAAAAEGAGCRLFGSDEELSKHGDRAPAMAPAGELDSEPDLCIALGGDGTILRALRHFAAREVPVFGVNYGTVGFLAAAESYDLAMALERAFVGDFEMIELPGLEVSLDGANLPALNDVSFTRRPHHRVADLSYRLGGKEVGHVRCDGLVAATPVGSTGYNLANGGPILAWGVEGYVVSFIAPHTLTARALVVAPDDVLHVHNLGDRDSVDVAVDGVPAGRLEPATEVSVGFRDRLALLAQMEGETFYRRIREKFGQLAH